MPARHLPALLALAALALAPSLHAQSYHIGAAGLTLNAPSVLSAYTLIYVRDGGVLTQNAGSFIQGHSGQNVGLLIGYNSSGNYTMNGGQLLGSNLTLGYSDDASRNGNGTMTQNGGEAYLSTGLRVGSSQRTQGQYLLYGGLMETPSVQIAGTAGDSNSTIGLFGGTLSTSHIFRSGYLGATNLTLSGGVLRVSGTSSTWGLIDYNVNALVSTGGAVIDLNGYNTEIRSVLQHHPGAGATDGGLTVRGTGTLTLTSTATYLGRTTLENGVLRITHTDTLQRSTVALDGGRLEAAPGSNLALGGLTGSGDLTMTPQMAVGRNGEDTTYSGVLSGAGRLFKEGTGNLTLTRENTYSDGTVVYAGALTLAGAPPNGIGIIRGALTVAGGNVIATSVNAFGWQTGAKLDTINISSGTVSSSAAGDQGWGVTYNLGHGAVLSSNGGTSSATTASKFAFGGGTGANTSVNLANNSVATIAGRIDLRGDNGNTNTDFNIIGNSSLYVTAAITSTNGQTGITKLGTGGLLVRGASTVNGIVNVKAGTLFVHEGGNMTNYGAVNIGTGGTVRITGSNSWWQSANVSLGEAGAGLAIIENGGRMSSSYSVLGGLNGNGAALVTGTGSRWDHSHGLIVGDKGVGVLVVEDGARVTNAETRLGLEVGSSGTASVTGPGSVWTSSLEMSLGFRGNGTLNIANGGVVNVGSGSGTVIVAQEAGSRGTINIGAAVGSAAVAAGTLNAALIHGGDAPSDGVSKRLNFNHTSDLTFSPTIAGAMIVRHYSGTTRLAAANSYTGGTVIAGGRLTAANHNALGSGVVQVTGSGALHVEDAVAFTNDVVLSGGSYSRAVSGNLAGKLNATSDLEGGVDTTAKVLAGSVSTTSTLITAFSATSSATNDQYRRSDVYHFDGTDTDLFVLELSFTSTEEGTLLGWLNGSNQWVASTLGNTGDNAIAAMKNYTGTWAEFLAEFQPTYGSGLTNYLGAFGTDTTGNTTRVWAVLNHNSDFAVIPEPATASLLVVGALALLRRRRAGQREA